MRLLVDGAGLRGAPRIRAAALGLAARGHQVWWSAAAGDDDALGFPGVEPAPLGFAVARTDAELVLGGGRPARAAALGWLVGAHVLVASVPHAQLERWTVLDRLGWQSLHSFALIEESDAEGTRGSPGPLALERVGLWSGDAAPAAPDPAHLDTEILERACERSLARHRGGAPRPAVFLDRDGTIIEEVGYLDDPRLVRLLPGAAGALRALHAAGFALVVVSNQAGVGRGLYPLARVHEVMAELRRSLRREGVELDGVYFCPHHPEAGCDCRKPGTALIERADDDLRLDIRRSIMVGDRLHDVEAGRRAGARGVLVRTGYGAEEEVRLGAGASTEVVVDDLGSAARWLLDHLADEDGRGGAGRRSG
jgi:histidinol-phosphate phosphatase family protein